MNVIHFASVTACNPHVEIISAIVNIIESTAKAGGPIGSTLVAVVGVGALALLAPATISHRSRSNLRNLCRFLIDSAPKQLPMLPRLWRNSKRPRRGKGRGQSEATWSRYRAMGVQIDSTQWVVVKKAKPKKRSPRL
jgi:hypothetical protein